MKRTFLWAILLSAIGAVFAAAFALRPAARFVPERADRTEQHPWLPAPSFTLTDQSGHSFDSGTLRGRAWIADFIFTSCAGSCPRMSEQMSLLQKRLPAEVRFVSISVDPQRDTPAVLAEYARRYSAQEGRWYLLTGPADAIAKIVQKGFRLSYAEGGSPEEPVTHSVRFVLVDRGGMIRGAYDSTEPSQFEQLIRDAGAL